MELTNEMIDDIIANNKGDLYKQLASKQFNIPYEEVTNEQRREMKRKYFAQIHSGKLLQMNEPLIDLVPANRTTTKLNFNYCPNCGLEIKAVQTNSKDRKLLDGGRVYQCANCGSMYKTGFFEGYMFHKISEHEFRMLTDNAFYEKVMKEDAEARRRMEEAYAKAAQEHSYDLPENYIKEED